MKIKRYLYKTVISYTKMIYMLHFFLGGGYKDDTRIGTVSMVLLTDLEFYYSNVILCLNCLLLFIVTSIANLLRHDKYMV